MAPPVTANPSSSSITSSPLPTFLYPLYGITHFLAHPYLYPLLRARLLPATILSTLVLITLFTWTYLPQAAFLALFHGRHGAFLNATFLVLGEGAAVTAILFECFLADEAQVNVFDAILVERGCEGLVAKARPVLDAVGAEAGQVLDPRKRLGQLRDKKAEYSPFSFRQIAEFILLLPLNLVPWIGVPLFLWLTGYRAGPLQHHRLFELKGLDKKEKRAWIQSRRLGYTSFGCTALVLQLVPVLSMVFLLTTAAGSALWAAEMEGQGGARAETTPNEPPPEYTEYTEYADNPV